LNALIFLFDNLSRLYLLCFLLRLLLQVARADFYHPVAQFVVAVTNSLVVPARRLLPSFRKFDLPTFVVLVVLQFAITIVLFAMRGVALRPELIAIEAVYQLATLTVWLYLVCIFVWVILSWLQSAYHPIAVFLGQLIEPVLRPARRLLPATGGFDVSPMIVTILLVAILIALNDVRAILIVRANGLY
jgi:YggT family protein